MEVTLIILILINMGLDILIFNKIKKLKEELSKEKRKHMRYKTELGLDASLEKFESIPKDYEENEAPYDGIAGDR